MTGMVRTAWRFTIGLAMALLAAMTPVAQDRITIVAEAGERWLDSDQIDAELLRATVETILTEPAAGLDWLGRQLAAAGLEPAKPRSKGVYGLCSQVTLEFLRIQQKRGMVFVGQYAPLEHLQPFASDFLFGLLLDTPDWYPLTFRVRIVPALRDLQPRQPSVARLDAVIAIVEDDRESRDLRWELAAMLWQWDHKKFAKAVVNQLLLGTTEGDAEDRVQISLQLADYYNLLREYRSAARAHRSAQALAKDAGVTLRPVNWYAAACVHSLLGEREQGMAALERCAHMHASADLDSSLRLERKLFEQDPEIALLRTDERFPALLELAFGPVPAMRDGSKGRVPDKSGR